MPTSNEEQENFRKLQVDTYKKVAGIFDSVTNRNNRNHLNKIRAIDNFLDIHEGERVLEIGIGTGIHARYILESNSNKQFQFYGVDISEDMLEEAKKKLGEGVILKSMAGEDLKFEDNYFDKVYISGSLHHFSDPQKGISELLRVLKPGGKFSIMEPNFLFPKNTYAAYKLPEEKNMRLMTKRNFKFWLRQHNNISYEITNFAYTPPYPVSLVGFFDVIDKIISLTPLLRNISIMLLIRGVKVR